MKSITLASMLTIKHRTILSNAYLLIFFRKPLKRRQNTSKFAAMVSDR